MEDNKRGKGVKALKETTAILIILLLAQSAASETIRVAGIDGNVDAGTAQYIDRVIKLSEAEGSDLVLIEVNTQGGLEKATRSVTKEIVDSKVKVVAYVPKKFEGAFSAGTFVVMASQVSAVDPQAYIGGAQPTPMDNATMLPLAGYLIALTEGKGRDTAVVRDTVTKNSIMNGREALEKKATDYAPENLEELLKDLNMPGAVMKASTPSLEEQAYSFFSNPQLISLFLLLGCLGTAYIGQAIYRGVAGKRHLVYALIPVASFIVTAWGIENIRFSPLGIFLIILGAGLVAAELFHTRASIFGITGLISIIVGIGIASSEPLLQISMGMTLAVMGLAAILIALSVLTANRIARQYLETMRAEAEALIGEKARVVEELRPNGIIKIGEKLRQAYSVGEERIEMGAMVQVVKAEGKVLNVMRVGGPKKSSHGHDAHGGDAAKGDIGHTHSLLPSKTYPNILHDHKSHAPSSHDDQSHHFTAGPDPNFFEHDHNLAPGPDARRKERKDGTDRQKTHDGGH